VEERVMPITVEVDEATLTRRLAIPAKPDEVVEEKKVWQMDEQALLDHPELSEALRNAQFQYLGVITQKGKKKSDPQTRTLLYTRAEAGGERDAVQEPEAAVQEGDDASDVDPAEGAPSEGADAGETDEPSGTGEVVSDVSETPNAEEQP
jgi:hypothetical protein